MFDVAPTELLLLGAVAVAVIPPKDLPRAMRFAGQWIGKARGMARHFRSGLDEMIRQSELDEIEKTWREENERIMREHPLHDAIDHAPPVSTTVVPARGVEPASPSSMLHSGELPSAAGGTAPPAAMPHDNAPTASTRGDEGSELPLGLPPAP